MQAGTGSLTGGSNGHCIKLCLKAAVSSDMRACLLSDLGCSKGVPYDCFGRRLDTADKRGFWKIKTWVPCLFHSSPNRIDALDSLDSSTPVHIRLFLHLDGMDFLALVQTERIIMHRFRLIPSESFSSTIATIKISPIGIYATTA